MPLDGPDSPAAARLYQQITAQPPPCRPSRLQEKIMPLYPLPLKDVAINIRPKAIPDGIGLYLKAWAASPGTHNGPYLTLQADLVQASPRCTG